MTLIQLFLKLLVEALYPYMEKTYYCVASTIRHRTVPVTEIDSVTSLFAEIFPLMEFDSLINSEDFNLVG